jgi:nitrosocyanin
MIETKTNKVQSITMASILASALLLSACTTQTTETTPDNAPDDAQVIESTQPTATGSVDAMTAAEANTVTVDATNFKFNQTELKVKKGDKVKVVFNNKEGLHDFVLDEFNAKTKQLKAGESEIIEFTADKAGTFEYYCSVGQHRQMGMVGKLIVE